MSSPARVAGSTTITYRRGWPRNSWATHAVNSRETDLVEAVRKITGGGTDFALASSDRPVVLRQAIDALAIRGVCGIIGAPALGTEASFDVNGVMTAGKRIIGIIEGESVPDLFIQSPVELYTQGHFPFDKLEKSYYVRPDQPSG